MKNSDIPAIPCEIEARVAQDNLGVDLNSAYEWYKAQSGLTKREMFAMHFMASWINHHGSANDYGFSVKNAALSAIECADTLLSELEN